MSEKIEHKYNPYVINIDFDKEPEYISDKKWVAGAIVDIGDRNYHLNPNIKKLRKKSSSLGYDFLFYICSPEYKLEPENGYEIYKEIMHVQNKYDPIAAGKWLINRIDDIGVVEEQELTKNFHQLFNTEDWDFDLQDNK